MSTARQGRLPTPDQLRGRHVATPLSHLSDEDSSDLGEDLDDLIRVFR